ncbi:polyamine aminopropyltransferase [Corynebacterium lowii]|uniref:Polyamine aminopropyltransferase n=1 Tax=Corynebacterium lowii TaxID=1544413 RepID=A0A0Q0YIV4_9CORY|nr:polyamine aminopropyltransferase [Corynebacterium lowii]KQB86681.1 Spermidine synthase [Corynebacterium lowii]MDP9851366.1 spermidine synthase [Corynebacterium lowii]
MRGSGQRWWRFLLLVSVAICAACGLVYELALISLATSTGGGGIVETSLIVAGYVAALGVGAVLVRPLLRWPAESFLAVEAVLGIVGGFSAMALYAVFAVIGQSVVALVLATAVLGMLVGAELPLLLTLVQQGQLVDARGAGRVVATLNAADYVGALLGGLAWPFLLLPLFGLIRGTAAAGLLNLVAALFLACVVLRSRLSRRRMWVASSGLVAGIALIVTLLFLSPSWVVTARQQLYADPVVYAHQSQYQDIVVTQRGKDRRLYLNGGLQYSTRDEYRYTESLVYPALRNKGERVLVIGGGDGLAAKELSAMEAQIVQVELDPEVIEVANTVLREDNGGALEGDNVQLIVDDAFTWLRKGGDGTRFDAVIIDLPDPDNETMARLYSEEFYTLARSVLSPQGRMTVQASSAYSTPDVFWRVRATLESAGCGEVVPYHVMVPTFGDWGFHLCAPEGESLSLPPDTPPLRFVSEETLAAARVFGADNQPQDMEPSTLDRPFIVDDMRRGYR